MYEKRKCELRSNKWIWVIFTEMNSEQCQNKAYIYIKAWTGVDAMTIFDTGAVLYQLSKQAN